MLEKQKLEGLIGLVFKESVGQELVEQNKVVNIITYNLNLLFSNKHSSDLIEKQIKWSPDLKLILDLNNTGKCTIIIYNPKLYFVETIEFKRAVNCVEFVTKHPENRSFNLGVLNCNSSDIGACISDNSFSKIAVLQWYKQEKLL